MTTEPGTTSQQRPRVGSFERAAGWAPYRFGHWGWVDPWGWTWVDDSSWGFAPFHYGRWAYQNARWEWSPGAVQARPVYAPLSSSSSGGSGWAPSAGEGIGWFAPGPREVYIPPYQVSADTSGESTLPRSELDAQTARENAPRPDCLREQNGPAGNDFRSARGIHSVASCRRGCSDGHACGSHTRAIHGNECPDRSAA